MSDHATALPSTPDYTLPAPLAATLAGVCQPLPEAQQAAQGSGGASLRYSQTYQTIRVAREEDDPTLPRGEWTRPLKRADWPRVIALCEAALRTESRDFQLAGWLSEAWSRYHGIDGVCAGLMLFEAMIEQDWAHGHPSIREGELDARLGVFTWLRDTLAASVTRYLPLLEMEERVITLDDWQRLLMTPPNRPRQPVRDIDFDDDGHIEHDDGSDPDDAPPPLRRAALIDFARGEVLLRLERLRASCGVALALLPSMIGKLDLAAGQDTPSFERVAVALSGLQRAAISLIAGRIPEGAPHVVAPVSQRVGTGKDGDADTFTDAEGHPLATAMSTHLAPIDAERFHAIPDPTGYADTGTAPPEQSSEAMAPTSVMLHTPSGPVIVHDRRHAYQLIEALANYLIEREPHSPTPYLLMRGASWGNMSLLELMQDISQEDGDMQRYFAAVGVKL